MALKVELVSPERIAYSGMAKMVIVRTIEGDIAFLPGHVPFIGVLDTYPVRVLQEDDTAQVIAVHQGFVEVAPDGDDTRVTILSDVCEMGDVIDIKRAERAREAAQHQLTADPDDLDVQAALARAEVRLAVGEGRPTELRPS